MTIDLKANHLGFFGFRICPNNNINVDPQPSCFENHSLTFENGESFHFVPKVHPGQNHVHNHPTRIPLR